MPLCVHASQDPIISENHTHALGANSTQAVCVAENVIGRQEQNGGNGVGAQEEIAYTLNTVGVHGVATNVVMATQQGGAEILKETCPTITASAGMSGNNQPVYSDGLSIRRLTPLECERLQGFPDNWTKIPYRGKDAKDCPDSPRYKACGNAVTVAVAKWVLSRLVKFR